MNITQSNFFLLLSGIKQYQIPIYQRNYAWEKENCKRLLDDIEKTGTPGNPKHYMGSVIVINEPSAGGVNIYSVIDGQQRLTTVTLLLLALNNYWSTRATPTAPETTIAILEHIKEIYLVNTGFSQTSLNAKVLPKAGTDRTEYENLLRGVIGSGGISEIYSFLLKELNSGAYNPIHVFQGLSDAQLALVELNPGESPQLLFEAVNDTGVDLSNVDLIRNWLFMGLTSNDQDRLYRAYWEPIEAALLDNIEPFLAHFTQLHTTVDVPKNFYQTFKKVFILRTGNAALIGELLQELKDYSDIYLEYLNGRIPNAGVQNKIDHIRHTKKELFVPLILKILKQCKDHSLAYAEAQQILTYLEAYIVRRDMLGIPTNLLKTAMKAFLQNSDSLSSFTACINGLSAKQKMPADTEMFTQLRYRDFYHLSDANYYLERIEKHLNAAFSLEDLTVEHILPETMHTNSFPKTGVRDENVNDYNWEIDLGPTAQVIHDTYQHTLGNLTILPRGENARMGDLRFEIKKNWQNNAPDGFRYGYLHTSIRISQNLRRFDKWNEESILQRCNEMVQYICVVWPHP